MYYTVTNAISFEVDTRRMPSRSSADFAVIKKTMKTASMGAALKLKNKFRKLVETRGVLNVGVF